MTSLTPTHPPATPGAPAPQTAGQPPASAQLPADPAAVPAPPRGGWSVLLLLAACVLGHFGSWDLGLFLDDHGHRAMLRSGGWSYSELVRSCRLDYAGDIMLLWWQGDAPVQIVFYRPLSFLFYKLEYHMLGGSPTGMHLVGLGLHMLCTLVVWRIGRALFGIKWAALFGGLIFSIHPQLLQAVQWNASRTELWAALFMLLAVWRHIVWIRRMQDARAAGLPPSAAGYGWVGTLILTALALFCRENAVILPVMLLAADLCLRGRQALGRWWFYLACILLSVIYLALRTAALGGFPTPPPPYFRSPADADFWPWAIVKSAYIYTTLFSYLPAVPVGTMVYLTSRPWLAAAVIVPWFILFALLLWRIARLRSELLAMLLLAGLAMLPTVPLFEASWYLYTPAAFASLVSTCVLAQLAGHGLPRPPWSPMRHRRARQTAILAALLLLGIVSFGTYANRFAFAGAVRREQDTVADVLATLNHPAPPDHTTDMVFINLPLVAHYITPAVREAANVHNLQGWVVSFAPRVAWQDRPFECERVAPNTLRLRQHPDRRWFAEALGQALYSAGRRGPLQAGERFDRPEMPFAVEISQADSEGVIEMLLHFRRPLCDPSYRIYIGTPARAAFRLIFHTHWSDRPDAPWQEFSQP